jgi:hypothetical protein
LEKGYKNIVYCFVFIAAMTFLGFYKRYFALVPDFPGIKNIHHLHVAALIIYLALLIVQPVLIHKKKFELHRIIGKFSYFLAPVVFVSILLVYRNQYLRMVSDGKPLNECLAFIFAPATDAIPFLIFYILAILNKGDTAKHMRYIIATGIVVAGPGYGRIFITWFGMDFFAALGLVSLTTLVAFVGLIIYDRVKKKQFRVNPFAISFIIWLIPNILVIFFPNTTVWQNIAQWMVKAF